MRRVLVGTPTFQEREVLLIIDGRYFSALKGISNDLSDSSKRIFKSFKGTIVDFRMVWIRRIISSDFFTILSVISLLGIVSIREDIVKDIQSMTVRYNSLFLSVKDDVLSMID